MLLEICKWYAVVIYVLGAMTIIAKDGESTTNYTGKYKLAYILISLPTWYFIYQAVTRL